MPPQQPHHHHQSSSHSKEKIFEVDEHIMRRFDVQKRLGKGAYGIVWKAIDRKTRQVIAVKKIFDAFRNKTDAQRTFREIMFLQSLKDHPNVVRLHSVHRAANNSDIYLGFEYMETDLHNVIKRKILKDVHKKYVMYQLLKAIKYIHSGNVIHRDLKPSNVLLDINCRCKIADFGLARSLAQANSSGDGSFGDTDPTLTDYVATRWYRAPEILIANRRYTKGIDMWSLGCILAEMLAGKAIFPGTSTVNQVEKIMATIPTPSPDDLSHVCVSGMGSAMIKNACTATKVPFTTLLGARCSRDAQHLLSQLLVFNPTDRLTAAEALESHYVATFRDPDKEIEMTRDIVIPFNDDVQLSVEDYRNKLYEVMSQQHHHRSSGVHRRVSTGTSNNSCSNNNNNSGGDIYANNSTHNNRKIMIKGTSATSKLLQQQQQQPRGVRVGRGREIHSDSRIATTSNNSKNNNVVAVANNSRSDSKVIVATAKQNLHLLHAAATGVASAGNNNYTNGTILKSSGLNSSYLKNKAANTTKNSSSLNNNKSSSVIYTKSYNSYNRNHGIITQSALMELKTAGLR